MSPLLQNLIVLGAALVAAGYLARRAWRTFSQKKSGGCGGCGNCPSNNTVAPAVTLQVSPGVPSVGQHRTLQIVSPSASSSLAQSDSRPEQRG